MNESDTAELDGALAPTAAGEGTQSRPPLGLEYRQLKARTREALFGVTHDPVRIGRFAVLRRIGEGGMGVVYSAYDDELERKVAIKLVRPELGLDHAQIRIRREAQAAARLSHPNVVSVYEIGEHEGRLFVAMEFVRGQTLRQWLRGGPRPWQSIVDVFIDAGHGLQAAHAAGLVHRDFKPDNVMIGDEVSSARGHGRVRVLDFGVARRVASAVEATDDLANDGGAAASRPPVRGTQDPTEPGPTEAARSARGPTEPGPPTALTGVGALIGTPAFMAPEQLAGEVADARSDQFAFCLSMWLALFEEAPFAADEESGRSVVRAAAPIRLPSRPTQVPTSVRRLLERGLSPRREDRHPSMDGLIAGLIAARHRPRRWGIALALTAVTGVGAGVWATHEPSDCAAATAQLADVWDRGPRTRIHLGLRETALPGAAEIWLDLEPAIDGFADAWREASGRACAGSPAAGEQDVALQQRRCLASRLTDLRTLVAPLASGDATLLQAALATVRQWDPPAGCLDPEHLRGWAEHEAQINAPPPPGSADGLVSDFESDPISRFGFGWVKSTDEFIDGTSEVVIAVADVGAHGSARALRITGEVRTNDRAQWAGAMYFPGPMAMAAANLTSLPMLSFAARGTPGSYDAVLFTQVEGLGDTRIAFELDEQWREVQIDLRTLGAPLYGVTGIFIGRSDPGKFECFLDDVRLDGAPPR